VTVRPMSGLASPLICASPFAGTPFRQISSRCLTP
jgi:hypothetical protein